MSFSIMIFQDYMPRSGIVVSYGSFILSLFFFKESPCPIFNLRFSWPHRYELFMYISSCG